MYGVGFRVCHTWTMELKKQVFPRFDRPTRPPCGGRFIESKRLRGGGGGGRSDGSGLFVMASVCVCVCALYMLCNS